MKKKFLGLGILLLAAISSGYALYSILKKAGLEEIFDFDLDDEYETI